MSKIEELQAVTTLADQEAESQKTILRNLNLEVERTGESLTPHEYAALRAKVEQQESRTKAASRIACSRRLELDEERSKECARLSREQAERSYQNNLAELNTARAELETKRRALAQLQNEIPLAERRASLLLYSLDQAKTALERENVTA